MQISLYIHISGNGVSLEELMKINVTKRDWQLLKRSTGWKSAKF